MKITILFFLLCSIGITSTPQTVVNYQSSFTGNTRLPLIVGHRGGFDSSLPENSISIFDYTFKNACKLPVAIEFDIRESASGSLFIMHDPTVDRTTNGVGNISDLTDTYIESLFLRDRNGNLTSEKVPLFSFVLSRFQGKNIILMLDIKGSVMQKVVNLVKLMKMESNCILLTFSRENTELAKNIAGTMMISALVENQNDWELVRGLHIPDQQLIAYISEQTPEGLLQQITGSKVLLMTDMSEGLRNRSNHYEQYYYRNFIKNKQLGICISDYPVFVNKLFCSDESGNKAGRNK